MVSVLHGVAFIAQHLAKGPHAVKRGVGLAVFVGLLFELLVVLDDGIFTGFQHAVQTAQHRERNHDPAVLRWAVGTAQQVGDVPDDVAVGLEGVDIFHEALRD